MVGIGKIEPKLRAELCDMGASLIAEVRSMLTSTRAGGVKTCIVVTANDKVVIALHGFDRRDGAKPPVRDNFGGVLTVRAVHIDEQDTASGDLDPDSNKVSFCSKDCAIGAHDWSAAKAPAPPNPDGASPLTAVSCRAELQPSPIAAPGVAGACLLKEGDVNVALIQLCHERH